MSICKGTAGKRGFNPKKIMLHNDAGSKYANKAHYEKWLPTHNLANGFAHAYVTSTGTLIAEDDVYMAWHAGDYASNRDCYSIEICQSMGDIVVFLQNEEKALKLAAEKCKKYGITPSNSTIMLHQEVSATACPHRSVEVHGGRAATKAYFIKRIKEYMKGAIVSVPSEVVKQETSRTKDLGKVNITMQGFTDRWWPEVVNNTDWVGQADRVPLRYLAVKVDKGTITGKVCTQKSGWLPSLTFGKSYNLKDLNNGVLGDGSPIQAVVLYYNTPAGYKYKKAIYCVSDVNNETYYPNQIDDETGAGMDGYAGVIGVNIDKLKARIA